jgi:hypothetical protein
MDIFRTLIVPADQADLARTIASTLDPAHSQGMFETPLSPTGTEPATHFISTGMIGEGFAALIPLATWAQQGDPPEWVRTSYDPGKPAVTTAMCEKAGLEVTEAEVEALYAAADVTAEDPWAALGRLGLKIVTPPPAEPVEPVPAALETPDAA